MNIRVKAATGQGEKRQNMNHLKEAAQRSSRYDELEEMANTTQPDIRCRCGVRAEGCDRWKAAVAFRCNNSSAYARDMAVNLLNRVIYSDVSKVRVNYFLLE